MTSYKKLLEYLHYGREELAVKAFHELTDNRYKTGLKLLCPLRELDDNDKFHDYSGNDFHGTPTDVSIIGKGYGRNTFANGIPGTDDQYITFTGINLGTNDFSISIIASHHEDQGAGYNSGDAAVFHGFTASTQQAGIFYRNSGAARINVNNALSTTTEVTFKDSKPHLLTLVADRSTSATLYVDQDVSSSVTISGTSANDIDVGTWRIFKRDVSTHSWLTGGATWLMMWENRILTNAEHKDLCNLLKPRRFVNP